MLEKDIQKSCIHILDYWKSLGIIIHYDIMSDAGRKQIRGRWIMQTSKGRPDINVYFKYKEICGILFIEVKTKTGIQSQNQLNFMLKFKNISNVHYLIVRNPLQVSQLLENISGYTPESLTNEVG